MNRVRKRVVRLAGKDDEDTDMDSVSAPSVVLDGFERTIWITEILTLGKPPNGPTVSSMLEKVKDVLDNMELIGQ